MAPNRGLDLKMDHQHNVFSVDARIILTLGRDSIKDHTTVVLEVVKNSCDAEAGLGKRVSPIAEGRYLNVRKDYSPDKQKKATETVLDQAELICKDWAEA